jgi:hypothetical protein
MTSLCHNSSSKDCLGGRLLDEEAGQEGTTLKPDVIVWKGIHCACMLRETSQTLSHERKHAIHGLHTSLRWRKQKNKDASKRNKIMNVLTVPGTYRVYQKSFNGFARSYLRNPWDYRNSMGAKRCASFFSFMLEFKNIDYLYFPMSYGRCTKKLFILFLRLWNRRLFVTWKHTIENQHCQMQMLMTRLSILSILSLSLSLSLSLFFSLFLSLSRKNLSLSREREKDKVKEKERER